MSVVIPTVKPALCSNAVQLHNTLYVDPRNLEEVPFQDGMFPWGKEVDGPSNTVRPHPTLCFRRVLIPCRCCRGLRFQSSGTLTPSRTSLSLSRMASSGGITLASTCPHPVNAWRRFWLLSGGHLMLLCRGGIVTSSLFCPSTHTTLASYTICTYFVPD